MDVLRAAVAEVEDYTRIRATSATGASLAGPAVADVIHMIAELAENATMFSPPNTPVVIHGDTVGKGFAVEIEDRGLGISDEQLLRINDLLQNPPPFDPATSDQLGLFVAGQLAKRHDIKISLRPSPYGGTTAIVLIPQHLVVPEGSHAKDPAAPVLTDGTLRFKGHHAALDWARDGEGDGGASPAPVPTGAATSWAGAMIPAMRDPADTLIPNTATMAVIGIPNARPLWTATRCATIVRSSRRLPTMRSMGTPITSATISTTRAGSGRTNAKCRLSKGAEGGLASSGVPISNAPRRRAEAPASHRAAARAA